MLGHDTHQQQQQQQQQTLLLLQKEALSQSRDSMSALDAHLAPVNKWPKGNMTAEGPAKTCYCRSKASRQCCRRQQTVQFMRRQQKAACGGFSGIRTGSTNAGSGGSSMHFLRVHMPVEQQKWPGEVNVSTRSYLCLLGAEDAGFRPSIHSARSSGRTALQARPS